MLVLDAFRRRAASGSTALEMRRTLLMLGEKLGRLLRAIRQTY